MPAIPDKLDTFSSTDPPLTSKSWKNPAIAMTVVGVAAGAVALLVTAVVLTILFAPAIIPGAILGFTASVVAAMGTIGLFIPTIAAGAIAIGAIALASIFGIITKTQAEKTKSIEEDTKSQVVDQSHDQGSLSLAPAPEEKVVLSSVILKDFERVTLEQVENKKKILEDLFAALKLNEQYLKIKDGFHFFSESAISGSIEYISKNDQKNKPNLKLFRSEYQKRCESNESEDRGFIVELGEVITALEEWDAIKCQYEAQQQAE